jgi:hypothetical protein
MLSNAKQNVDAIEDANSEHYLLQGQLIQP